MKKRIITLYLFLLLGVITYAASPNLYVVRGQVIEKRSREPLPYVNVSIVSGQQGAVTDSLGRFTIDKLSGGIYRMQASFIGYKTAFSPEFQAMGGSTFLTIEMEEASTQLNEVRVIATPIRRTVESPVALHLIGFSEIERSAGGNRDISRIVQSFPGVSSSPAGYRNDLIVRGGGPAENRFFVDGVEVPTINHFATQGASGGPVGILNADLIQDVNFYTGAFPATRGNALSSVMDFRLKEGNPDRKSLSFVVGSSEIGLSSDGNLGKKVTYLVSVRQSYLQFLFKALNLPFLPTFTDAQVKVRYRPSKNHELTFLALMAFDDMKLNTDTVGQTDLNKYTLSTLPVIKQLSYTTGLVYKHFAGRHVQTFVLSRSHLNNSNLKYQSNDETQPRILDLTSQESEHRLRVENRSTYGDFRITESVSLEQSLFSMDLFRKVYYGGQVSDINYRSDLTLYKWGASVGAEYAAPDNRLSASIGMRIDGNSFNANMQNPFRQFSPRASISYSPIRSFFINANAGRYYQLPPSTALGFRNNAGQLVNGELTYQAADHYILGIEHRPSTFARFTVEGFYKNYSQSLLSVLDGIPLSSKGNDYGAVGNEALTSTARGRSYGVEVMGRWYGYKNLNFIASYTWVRSQFMNPMTAGYIPSSWDNEHLFTLTGSYDLPRGWTIGGKFRLVGGAPYTPYDADRSSLIEVWNAYGRALFDYNRYNAERLPLFTQLDLRVDKTFYLRKVMIGIFVQAENALNTRYRQAPVLISTGVVNPADPSRYLMREVDATIGTVVPSIGLMIRL